MARYVVQYDGVDINRFMTGNPLYSPYQRTEKSFRTYEEALDFVESEDRICCNEHDSGRIFPKKNVRIFKEF